MTRYIVTRHGSNAANQPMTPSMIVGTVEATCHGGAIDRAEDKWTYYSNQHFSAKAVSEATQEEQREAGRMDALAEGVTL